METYIYTEHASRATQLRRGEAHSIEERNHREDGMDIPAGDVQRVAPLGEGGSRGGGG